MEREIETMKETPHWSYSAFNTYLTCPMRYYFRYIEHAEVERTSASIPFGRAFHAVLSERAMKGSDYTVEDALYRRAVGYNYEEKVFELIEGEVRLTKVYERHMPPDTKAIMHYLFNRKPEVWRAIQEPLEATQYTEAIKNILVAMKEVAENGHVKQIAAVEMKNEE